MASTCSSVAENTVYTITKVEMYKLQKIIFKNLLLELIKQFTQFSNLLLT